MHLGTGRHRRPVERSFTDEAVFEDSSSNTRPALLITFSLVGEHSATVSPLARHTNASGDSGNMESPIVSAVVYIFKGSQIVWTIYFRINRHTCEVPNFLGINAPSVRTTAWEESAAMEEVAKKASDQGLERRDPIQSSLLGEKST